jgi:hypothetical protein
MRLLGHQEAAPSPVTSQDEPTDMLNAGAALAISAEEHFGYNDNTLWQDPVSPEQWARENALPPVPQAGPRHRPVKRAKVPWFVTAGALAIAVATAGGAATLVYNLSNAKAAPSVSPGLQQGKVGDDRQGGKESAIKNRPSSNPIEYGGPKTSRGASATPTSPASSVPVPVPTKKPPPKPNPSPDPQPTETAPSPPGSSPSTPTSESPDPDPTTTDPSSTPTVDPPN